MLLFMNVYHPISVKIESTELVGVVKWTQLRITNEELHGNGSC